jgi:pilus assembly protein Flp/PilA
MIEYNRTPKRGLKGGGVNQMSLLAKLYRGEEGQGLIEYALIAALIAIAAIVALTFLGGKVGNTFNNIGANLG